MMDVGFDMSIDDYCVICNGLGKLIGNSICTYCNGTGEPNTLAEEYKRNHLCQCKMWDEKFCPICREKCHHDSSLSPTQKIDPGGDGASFSKSYKTENHTTTSQEIIIIA